IESPVGVGIVRRMARKIRCANVPLASVPRHTSSKQRTASHGARFHALGKGPIDLTACCRSCKKKKGLALANGVLSHDRPASADERGCADVRARALGRARRCGQFSSVRSTCPTGGLPSGNCSRFSRPPVGQVERTDENCPHRRARPSARALTSAHSLSSPDAGRSCDSTPFANARPFFFLHERQQAVKSIGPLPSAWNRAPWLAVRCLLLVWRGTLASGTLAQRIFRAIRRTIPTPTGDSM